MGLLDGLGADLNKLRVASRRNETPDGETRALSPPAIAFSPEHPPGTGFDGSSLVSYSFPLPSEEESARVIADCAEFLMGMFRGLLQVYDAAAAHAFLSGSVMRERYISCFDIMTKKIIELDKEAKVVREDFSKALLEAEEGKKEVQLLRNELTVKAAQISEIDKLKLELESEKSRVRELESSMQREVHMRRDTLLSFPRLFRLALEHKDVMGVDISRIIYIFIVVLMANILCLYAFLSQFTS